MSKLTCYAVISEYDSLEYISLVQKQYERSFGKKGGICQGIKQLYAFNHLIFRRIFLQIQIVSTQRSDVNHTIHLIEIT